MSEDVEKPISRQVNDSLTTRHIERSNELLRSLTTAHLQNKIGKPVPPSSEGNSSGGAGNSGGQPQGSGDKK